MLVCAVHSSPCHACVHLLLLCRMHTGRAARQRRHHHARQRICARHHHRQQRARLLGAPDGARHHRGRPGGTWRQRVVVNSTCLGTTQREHPCLGGAAEAELGGLLSTGGDVCSLLRWRRHGRQQQGGAGGGAAARCCRRWRAAVRAGHRRRHAAADRHRECHGERAVGDCMHSTPHSTPTLPPPLPPLLHALVQVGTRASCTQSLSTSWSVCSLRLGSGVGSVHVNLSAPVAVADFSASPLSITGPGNDASRPPLGLGTSSLLSLSVLFDDGSVRHFSADARTTFAVTAGAALCRVSPGARARASKQPLCMGMASAHMQLSPVCMPACCRLLLQRPAAAARSSPLDAAWLAPATSPPASCLATALPACLPR